VRTKKSEKSEKSRKERKRGRLSALSAVVAGCRWRRLLTSLELGPTAQPRVKVNSGGVEKSEKSKKSEKSVKKRGPGRREVRLDEQ